MAPAANTVSVGVKVLNFQVPDRLIRGQNHPAGFPVQGKLCVFPAGGVLREQGCFQCAGVSALLRGEVGVVHQPCQGAVGNLRRDHAVGIGGDVVGGEEEAQARGGEIPAIGPVHTVLDPLSGYVGIVGVQISLLFGKGSEQQGTKLFGGDVAVENIGKM